MPALSLLIKPASSLCDLRCKYCFYANVADHRDIKSYGFMSEATVDTLIDRALAYSDTSITFAFQGGEPTLAGLDYFKYFVEKTNASKGPKVQVNYALQTNAMHITEEMAAFFAEHHFLLGVSLDGPKEIHDLNRVGPDGKGSYKTVLQAIKRLNQHSVDFNILTVVSKSVAKHPQKIYQYFKKSNYRYLQFIPCLDELGKPHGENPYALIPKDYGSFLSRIFDLWYKDFMEGRRISIRMFDNILQILLGYPPESCDMNGICSANLVIEADGSTYPCDFYVLDEWRLGMIQDMSLNELITSNTAKEFVSMSIDKNPTCASCEYLSVCRSGCRRHKTQDMVGNLELNYFCPSYMEFYGYTLDRFKEIASILYREMQQQR